MSYQVLARKWRPRRFEEIVGQRHVLQALVNALNQGRLHHAYLFTGTRGVGKTTIARIFAKSLNCETGVSATPCGECSSCREIDEGRFIDLIEVDAASRTKVDETRELLENVHYSPTRGRYKVYLIDEVHMFSNHSFNALLKTLEEPPPHVKFLLATTDPKKLPITILSRCLQFNLKRLGSQQIEAQLEKILTQEGIASDKTSRRLIAQAADGSVRDALSLLDQAISYGGGALREHEVSVMLGAIDRERVSELLRLIAGRDAAGVLKETARIAESTPDFAAVLGELLTLLQRVAVVQLVGETGEERVEDDDRIRDLASRLSPEDCQLYYQIGLIGRRDLPLAPDPRGGLEMVLLRMLAFQPVSTHAPAAAAPLSAAGNRKPCPSGVTPTAAPADAASAVATTQPRAASVSVAVAPAMPPALASLPGADTAAWQRMIEEMGLRALERELAAQCVFRGVENGRFRLALSPVHANLRNPKVEARLEQAVQARYGADLRLALAVEDVGAAQTPAQEKQRHEQEQEAAAAGSIRSDPNVLALQESFGAVIETTSVRR